MFFTQEDYRNIEAWLQQRAMKDTDLPVADLSLDGREKIPIIQNGENKIVGFGDFIKRAIEIKLPNFLSTSWYKAEELN